MEGNIEGEEEEPLVMEDVFREIKYLHLVMEEYDEPRLHRRKDIKDIY
jgi:hypothetical protein